MRRSISTLLAVTAIMSCLPLVQAVPDKTASFSDVPSSAWYFEPVRSVHRYGLIAGKENGKFDPSGSVSNAEAITLACRVHSLLHDGEHDSNLFSVNWKENSVSYAVKHGICPPEDTSMLEQPASRETLCIYLYYAMPEDTRYLNSYSSVPGSSRKEILELYKLGIIRGVNDLGQFKGDSSITRAEMAAITLRIVDPNARYKIPFIERGVIESNGVQIPYYTRGNFSETQIERRREIIESMIDQAVPAYLLSAYRNAGGSFGYEQSDLMQELTRTESASAYYNSGKTQIVLSAFVGVPVVLHELGHFVDREFGNEMRRAELYDRYKEILASACSSNYALEDDQELFAEVFSTYLQEPNKIRSSCPEYFEYIEQILDTAEKHKENLKLQSDAARISSDGS